MSLSALQQSILTHLFTAKAPLAEKKSLLKRFAAFFVPDEFEVRAKKDVLTEMLTVSEKTWFQGEALKPEEGHFLKEIVNAYLAEYEVDDEVLEQRARKKWLAVRDHVATVYRDERNAQRPHRDKDKLLSEKKKRSLFVFMLAREKELAIEAQIDEHALWDRLVKSKGRQGQFTEREKSIYFAAKAKLDDLMEKSSDEVEALTTYKVDTPAKRIRYFLGWLFSIIYSIGCGLTTAGAFLIVFSGGAAIPLFVAILVAGFIINYAFTRKNTPEVITATFSGLDSFKKLSAKQKAVLGVGIVLSLATGFAAAILTYSGALGIVAFFSLSSFPPALIFFIAAVSGICIATVMIHGIKKSIEGNALEKAKRFFANFIKPHWIKEYDKDGVFVSEKAESKLGRCVRIGLTISLFVIFFGFAMIGCVLNNFSANLSMVELFWKVNHAMLRLCQIVSAIIASMAVFGELQLHVDTAKRAAKALIQPFIVLYQEAKRVWEKKSHSNPRKIFVIALACILFIPVLIINMFGNGMVAGRGAGSTPFNLAMSALIAGIQSFVDTFRDYKDLMDEKIDDWCQVSHVSKPRWAESIEHKLLEKDDSSPRAAAPTQDGGSGGGGGPGGGHDDDKPGTDGAGPVPQAANDGASLVSSASSSESDDTAPLLRYRDDVVDAAANEAPPLEVQPATASAAAVGVYAAYSTVQAMTALVSAAAVCALATHATAKKEKEERPAQSGALAVRDHRNSFGYGRCTPPMSISEPAPEALLMKVGCA